MRGLQALSFRVSERESCVALRLLSPDIFRQVIWLSLDAVRLVLQHLFCHRSFACREHENPFT